MLHKEYDVVVIGGGLAGLTLSLQLKQANSAIRILVLEKRAEAAAEAAHKVGESTVELGTHYLREVLNLKEYLEEFQLPKHGLRFYFSPKHKNEIEKRVELGPRKKLPVPSHQIDRGTFENELERRSIAMGNEVILGADVERVELFSEGNKHAIHFNRGNSKHKVSTKWAVDTSGRNFLLKRQLQLLKDLDHDINASWFRVSEEIDVSDWSNDTKWVDFLEPGLRRLGTIHFMDKGYWLWLIPLSSGATSVGIVADAKIHPFAEFNRLSKAMEWIEKNEPQAAKHILPLKDKVLDFHALKHYSHHSENVFSADRWAISGEAGAFLDPWYSPGTDFISLSNTFLTDLILRDMNGENIELHASIYEKTYLSMVDNWIPVYQNKYQLMGNTQIMVCKIFWDWATYWSFFTLLFVNNGLTNISLIKRLFASQDNPAARLKVLNEKTQQLFIDWLNFDKQEFSERYVDPFDIPYLRTFHTQLEDQLNAQELLQRIEENLIILEKIAAELYRKVSHIAYQTSEDMVVNPYRMNLLEKTTFENDPEALFVDKTIQSDMDRMWFYSHA